MVTVQRIQQRHQVDWVTASPLWRSLPAQPPTPNPASWPSPGDVTFRQPAILRFTTDTFMEDFLAIAATDPERLHEWQVKKETWRIPAPTPSVSPDGVTAHSSPESELTEKQRRILDEQTPIKLYQPANQRFYLVTANLVCRIPGLPDKMLKANAGETVSFVLRRVINGQEHALIQKRWFPIPSSQLRYGRPAKETVQPDEQQFPMFPVTYHAEQDGHKRRLFAGLVPVSGREAYVNAAVEAEHPSGSTAPEAIAPPSEDWVDQLMTVVEMDVLEPWDALGEQFEQFKIRIAASLREIEASEASTSQKLIALGELNINVQQQRDQIQVASWYLLLDFAEFLATYLNPVWTVIQTTAQPSTLGSHTNSHPLRQLFEVLRQARFEPDDAFDVEIGQSASLYEKLITGKAEPTAGIRLTELLQELSQTEPSTFLETTTLSYDTTDLDVSLDPGWPSRLSLCGSQIYPVLSQLRDTRDATTRERTQDGLLRRALIQIFQDNPNARPTIPLTPESQPISKSAFQRPDAAANQPDQFYIRCVFNRPHCPPALRQVVSDPTIPFQMASYFDPDAPTRSIRIPMPVDTTPAGLRKFSKNAMFVISDALACQIEMARKLTLGDLVLSVLPWPFHRKLPNPRTGTCKTKGIDIGKLCTLSIPIITICALILLIIMVLVLDYIFKWVPYLIFCLPLPGLNAKPKKPGEG